MLTPKFQHRHFATVADIVKRRFTQALLGAGTDTSRQPNDSVTSGVNLWSALEIAEIMAQELSYTNPRFDRGRFMRACGFDE